MKTVIIDYAVISPVVLEVRIHNAFPGAQCLWHDVDEDFFEFSVFGVCGLDDLEDVLAEYV